MVGTTVVLPVLAVIIAFIVVSINIRGKGREINQTQMMNQPLIGGTSKAMKHQGPWPECMGISGSDCKDLIEKNADDVTVYIVPHDSFMTMDFRTDRVRIFVDDDNVVVKIPNRG